MKLAQHPRTPAILLSCSLISACSMGTEVGNGNRPKKETTTHADNPDPSTIENSGNPMSSSPTLLNLLSARCGGPFHAALSGPLTISPVSTSSSASPTPIRAELINDTWQLSQGTATATVSLDGSDGNSGVSCDQANQESTSDAEGTLIHHRITYSYQQKSYINEWWVRPAASNNELPRLERISLKAPDGSQMVSEKPGTP